MVDLKRGASMLPFLIALMTPAFSDDAVSPGTAPCVESSDQASNACPPSTATTSESSLFAPSLIETAPPRLPELQPESPSVPTPRPELPGNSPTQDASQQLPPRDPGAPEQPVSASAAQQQEKRLHEHLTWDYCGPRPGAKGLTLLTEPDSGMPIDITADRIDGDQNSDILWLQGDTEILQNGRRLEADQSRYDQRSGQVNAAGHLYLESPGLRLIGDSADYNLETKQGTVNQAQYRVSGNANLRGAADHAWLLSDQLSRYESILYTTCPPGHSDWSIRASTLELDQASGMGTARHARLRIADVPVLYSPYLRFPIDGRRHSGFLIPSLGTSNATGTNISLPYYWNIAPNMDATITPRIMSERGLMLDTQFRYLASFQKLEVNTELLPHDSQAPELGIRGALRVKQQGQLSPRWFTSVDFASVSDEHYLQDFGNRLNVTSLRSLTQRADLNYQGDGWRLLSWVQEFQTIDPSITPASRPYGQRPHVELDLDTQRLKRLFEYDLDAQYDYFDHTSAVHGSRLVAVPSLRIPLRRSFGYLIPSARLFYTHYDLIDQTAGLPQQPSYLIPNFDLDGKLIFERESNWFGDKTLQTIEPRLYYVLTPYTDQSKTPLFDTTALDFSFASLFRPNRFTGYDRIGDENRLTLGLTSRTIANRSGDELFRASIGQIYYFSERRVQLSGDGVENDIGSSIAGEFAARLHPNWTALVSAQWNPNQSQDLWEKQFLQLRYAPDNTHLLNLAYRYNLGAQISEKYEDTDITFLMPVGSQVKLVGRWLYSMLNNETIEAFAGLEFGRCCWHLRILGQHLKRSADTAGSTSVMLQLELAGLGSFGDRIDNFLEQEIYGYHSN